MVCVAGGLCGMWCVCQLVSLPCGVCGMLSVWYVVVFGRCCVWHVACEVCGIHVAVCCMLNVWNVVCLACRLCGI